MSGLDLVLYAGAAAVMLLPWSGVAPPAGVPVALAVGVVSLVAVWRGRWQAALITIAGTLTAGVFLAPAHLRLFLSVAPALCSVLGAFLLWAMPIPKLPKPSGPHRVGLKRFVLNPRVATQAGEQAGSLLIYAFYPADPPSGSRTRPYHSRQEDIAASRAAALLGGPGFLFSHFRLARTHVVEDAPEEPADGGRPLLIFNHGAVSAPTQCTVVMSELASHGYIVLSIGRPGESSGLAWPDGGLTPVTRSALDRLRAMAALPALKEYRRNLFAQDVGQARAALEAAVPELARTYTVEATLRWRDDSIALVDRMLRQDVPDSARPLARQVDPQRIGYFGMSLGGAVAHACCMADVRARAGVNLDGGNWDYAAIDQRVPTAFLNFYGDPALLERRVRKVVKSPPPASAPVGATRLMGNDFYYEPPRTAGLRQDVVRLIVPGASHGDFTDTILATRSPWRRWLGGGNIDSARMLEILNLACVEFFDKYISGKANDFPADALNAFPELIEQDMQPVRDWARTQAGETATAAP